MVERYQSRCLSTAEIAHVCTPVLVFSKSRESDLFTARRRVSGRREDEWGGQDLTCALALVMLILHLVVSSRKQSAYGLT